MSQESPNYAHRRSPFGTLLSFLRLAMKYIAFNFKSQLEYRAAFISQVLAMIINDCFWLAFWQFFYQRFHVLGHWNRLDLVTMWAITAAGFGLAHGIAGNAMSIASIIVKGQLDTWMLYPRAVLPHLLFGKMLVSAWGDAIFGVLAYLFIVHPSVQSFLLFLTLVSSVALLFVGFEVLVGSLGFLVGNAEGLSEQLRFALITTSTYPPSIFEGGVKLLMFTVIPAGFCSYLPVEALKQHSLELAFYSLTGAIIVMFIGTSAFYLGLRKYESGNLIEMRS